MTSRLIRRSVVGFAVALAGAAVACSETGLRNIPLGPTISAGLTAPTIDSPTGDVQLNTLRPTFTVRNGTANGQGARTYEFAVSDRSDFGASLSSIFSSGIAEGAGGTTSFTPAADLQPSTRMFWRSRMAQGGAVSEWTSTSTFRTKVGGFNRPGELFDSLDGATIGTRTGNTTFVPGAGLRIDDPSSYVRYQLASTLTSGEISVEVQGLRPNMPNEKGRIFSMMDGASSLFNSPFLFNAQYRGTPGNPDNAISYKVLHGSDALKYEPDFAQRSAGVRILNPGTTYLWTATWGATFRLVVREGGVNGPIIYERSHNTPGSYSPTPHFAFLGANDAGQESGSIAGAVYRNLWVGSGSRPASIGSALQPR